MKKTLMLFLVLGALSACQKSSTTTTPEGVTDSESNGADAAASVVGSASGAAEGVLGLMDAGFIATDFQSMDYLDPQSVSVHPEAACSLLSARSSCSSGVRTISWADCNLTRGKLSGGWTETFSDSACSMSSNGNSVVRTSTTGSILTFTSGATLTTSTEGGTTWDNTAMGSSGITVLTGLSGRSISINSIHQVLKGPRGRTWFDYFIQTSSSIGVSGTRAGGNRTISSGSLKIYHNVAEYTATHSFSTVVWGDSTCCYPTSGTITSAFEGSLTGSSTMTFTSSCGTATFTGTDGATGSVTLTQCQ